MDGTTVRSSRKEYDERIFHLWKTKAMSQVEIAIYFKIHVNTVARAIKRQQAKQQALKELGDL